MTDNPEDGAVPFPIDGILDLHMFKPSEAADLIFEYLSVCQTKGIFEVRIIHGKGTGQLRERVHAVLRRIHLVEGFGLADDASGWGATIVNLKCRDKRQ